MMRWMLEMVLVVAHGAISCHPQIDNPYADEGCSEISVFCYVALLVSRIGVREREPCTFHRPQYTACIGQPLLPLRSVAGV